MDSDIALLHRIDRAVGNIERGLLEVNVVKDLLKDCRSGLQNGKKVEVAETVGKRILLARKRRGWTQDQLSQHTGKGRASIALYEADTNDPPLDTIREIALALGTSPAFIAFGREQ